MKQHRKFSYIRITAPVPKIGVQMPLVVSPPGRERHPATTIKLSMLKFTLLKILASFCPELKGPRNIETASKRAQAMPAITPQEFLF
jgi:hypothetical protein